MRDLHNNINVIRCISPVPVGTNGTGKTGASPQTAKKQLRFRLHKGDESQLPDPSIESKVGAGRATAHRGLCYVFEDLALADFSNRIPNITAEITYKRTDEKPYQGLDFLTTGEGGSFSSYQRTDLAVDWKRGYGYFLSSSSDPVNAGIHRFNLATMREDRQARMSDVCTTTPDYFPDTLLCGEDGYLYLNVGSVTCSRRLGKLNRTLIRTARILRMDFVNSSFDLREVQMLGSAGFDPHQAPYRGTSVAWWLLMNAAILIGIAFVT